MDIINRAADILFGDNSRRKTLNIKFDASRNNRKRAVDLAQMIVDSEDALASGKSRLVTDIG